MKKLFLLSAILFSFTIKSQVATKAAQDTGNTKLNLIRLQTISNKTVNVAGTVTVAAHAITALPSSTSNLATNALQQTIDANITGLRSDEFNYFNLNKGIDAASGNWEMSSVTFTSNALTSAKFLCELVASTTGRDVIIRKIRISGNQTTPGVAFIDFVQGLQGTTGGGYITINGNSWQNNQAGTTASNFAVNVFTTNPTGTYPSTSILTKVPVYLSPEFKETTIDFTLQTNNMVGTFAPDAGLRGPALGAGAGTNCYLGLGGVTYTGGIFLVTIDYAERQQL